MSIKVKSVKHQSKINKLNKQIFKLAEDLQHAASNGNIEESSKIRWEINQKRKRIEALSYTDSYSVSEHAILRYIERVLCINLKQIEENILRHVEKNNNPLFELKIENKTVITVLERKS